MKHGYRVDVYTNEDRARERNNSNVIVVFLCSWFICTFISVLVLWYITLNLETSFKIGIITSFLLAFIITKKLDKF